MAQGYESSSTLSTGVVPARRWRLALVGLSVLCLGGAALAVMLALGLADVHPAGPIFWESDDPGGWTLREERGEIRLYQAPVTLPSPPYSLEMVASNRRGSAWGVWLEAIDNVVTLLVSEDGYFSVSDGERPQWQEFIHLNATVNSLWLDVRADGAATLYINKEYAWQGALAQEGVDWGWAGYREPQLEWHTMRLYAGAIGTDTIGRMPIMKPGIITGEITIIPFHRISESYLYLFSPL